MLRLNYRLLLLSSFVLIGVMLPLLASGCEPSFGQSAGLFAAVDPPEIVGSDDVTYEDETPIPSLWLQLPTSNDGLLRGNKAGFFHPQDRTFPGLRSHGWMGGQYGIVRTPARTPIGQTFTRLHQGIDVRPVYRDRDGVPLDTVRAIDGGTVVYVNNNANGSSYGRYVVVRHEWDGSPMYSLSAHLAAAWVRAGQEIDRGEPLGRMGYTGRGINRRTAHLHLEVTMLLNTNYQRWHTAFHRSANAHGLYNGLNMRGIDVQGLYLALQQDPALSFTEFVREQPIAYSIALPGDRPLDIFERYPWLGRDGVSAADHGAFGAWVVSFTREGVPVQITGQDQAVGAPTVVYVSQEVRRGHLSTAGILARSGAAYSLTRNGLGYMALLASSAGSVPPWF